MSNDIYSRDGQPYNFPAGLKVKGIELSGFDGAKAISLLLKDSDQVSTNLYDWVRSTNTTVASILANGVGGNSGPITTDNITDATPFGISLLKASSQTVAQNLLGVGTYVTVLSSQISDATTVGKTLLTAPSVAYVRSALSLGTAATTDSTAYATALQGTKADTALQPGDLPVGTTIPVAQISNGGTVGKSVLLASTQAIAQTALGLGTAATAASTDFATAAQGTLATAALQPSTQLTQANVTAATLSGVNLLKAADTAAQRTLLGLGTAATTSSTAYATFAQGSLAASALQPSTQLTQANANASTAAGIAMLKATDVAAQRTLLGLNVSDNTAFYGYWGDRPNPSTLAIGSKVIITNLCNRFNGFIGFLTLYVSGTGIDSGTKYYTLENGTAVMSESIDIAFSSGASGYTSTLTKMSLPAPCQIPGNLAPKIGAEFTFTYRQVNGNVSTRPTISVRYGPTGTASDSIIASFPSSSPLGSSKYAVFKLNMILYPNTGEVWTSIDPTSGDILPINVTADASYNYFTVWITGGVSGEATGIGYSQLKVSF